MEIRLLLCIITSEAVTQLIAKAEIFDGLRTYLSNKSNFFNNLLSCSYCISFWGGVFSLIVLIFWDKLNWFAYLMVLHRSSNILHDLISTLTNFKINLILKRK